MKTVFEMFPKVFNGIEVRRLGWPGYDLNIIVFKPLLGLLGGVLWIVVLLKVMLPLLHLQCLKAFHQTILQNFTVTPYHKVIPSSMLHCWCSCSVRYWFSSLLPHIHL